MTKVSLSKPPNNNIFDCFAQLTMQQTMSKLDKEEIPPEDKSKEKLEPPSDKHPQHPKRQATSTSRSSSPSDSHKDSHEDKMQSQKPSHGSPDRSPLGKFCD
jgi:hypothetical protein